MTDHESGIKFARTNVVVEDFLPVQVHGSLTVADEADTLFHDGTNVELVAERGIDSDKPDPTHLSYGPNTFVGGFWDISLEHQRFLRLVQERFRFMEGTAVERTVKATGHHFQDFAGDILDFAEIDRVYILQLAGHLESGGDLVDRDDSLGALE